MHPITHRYGRHLADFTLGKTYAHPWEVTVDDGLLALFQAGFCDATPLFASRSYARALGFSDRPLHPLLMLNLALSFSVHDVSEQCIAHLGYTRVGFCRALYAGSTVHARSTCIAIDHAAGADRGVVTVRTALFNDEDLTVCWLERNALLHAGSLSSRPADPFDEHALVHVPSNELPPELDPLPHPPLRDYGFRGFLDDFTPGDVLAHGVGRSIGETEHYMLTSLFRNSHPLHFDARFASEGGSFTGQPLVMGGLVLGWIVALASRDVAGQAVWDVGYEDGVHTGPVHAGDTLYSVTQVLAAQPVDARYGLLRLRHVGLKNCRPELALGNDPELFEPERDKPKAARNPHKVLEITRTLLVRRRAADEP